ncbi:peptidoglycan-binding protein [Streptomyces sp. NPDC001549]|uniref:peptidoglycan-binding domain-containing protein n=1 Tax=Streptomyces sp. NPDC001549 TaxID=3364586 RepID=UPI0036B7C446
MSCRRARTPTAPSTTWAGRSPRWSEDQPGFVDGSFGPKTYNAVVNFQRSAFTKGGADGVVGRYTWHHLIATVYFE